LVTFYYLCQKINDYGSPRVEYSLTETGRSLMPALTALIEWGKEHFDEVVTD
jgi:DNA-binding HxlR family transcriptional regulator